MAIDTSLLVAAPMLQDYFVDKDLGTPLAAGFLNFYQDGTSIRKNVYYQTGTIGSYTYVAFPNPIILSSVGTIQDGNGNDVIPYYYPYDESNPDNPIQTYYVTCYSSYGVFQWSRSNFPFTPDNGQPSTNPLFTNRNYIVNKEFWRNLDGNGTAVPMLTDLYKRLCPSQHSGFINNGVQYTDMRFIRTNATDNDTATFKSFTPSISPILTGDPTPETYLNLTCTNASSGGTKYFQIPICLHIANFANQQAVATIQGLSGSSDANVVTLSILQFLGSGGGSSTPSTIGTFNLSNTWTKYFSEFTFPSNNGVTLGSAGDDAFYLLIGVPGTANYNINIALPSIYLCNSLQDVPTNDISTYAEVDAFINTPRTGDIRIGLDYTHFYGWVPLNDGVIGNALSYGSGSLNVLSRANVDAWPLYNLIWTIVHPYTSGTANPICGLYTSLGVPVESNDTALLDFNANYQLALTKTLGRVLMGSLPMPQSLTFTYAGTANEITLGTATNLLFTGAPIYFSSGSFPSGITAGAIYYTIYINSTTISVASTYANALSGTALPFTSFAGSVFFNLNGTSFGEFMHTQLDHELALHNHPGSFINALYQNVGSSGSSIGTLVNTSGTTNLSIANDGMSQPFNIVQPATFYNMYMKL